MSAPGHTRPLFPTLLLTSHAPEDRPRAVPDFPQVAPRRAPQWLWLALHLPQLPLDAFAGLDADPAPVAVIDEAGGRSQVCAVNAAAAELGVTPGLGLNAAYALAPALQTLARDTALETQRLERLGVWASQFTSTVSLAPPDGLLLEIQGSLKLFGGLARLLESVRDGLGDLDVAAQPAVAPTPLAALWGARAGGAGVWAETDTLTDALGPLPLAVTRWPARLLATLDSMGVRRIGECLRLPRDGFSRRFGRERLAELDRALGKAPDPRDALALPATFDSALELVTETDRVALIETAAGRLLDELGGFLRGRQLALETFDLYLEHTDRPPTCLSVGLAALTRDVARLKSVLHERLDASRLAAPVIGVALDAARLLPLAGCDGDLFARGAAGYDWPQLVERLRARLGAGAVHGLCLVPEHRPEAAWRYVEPGLRGERFEIGRRPLWMLAEPVRLAVRAGRPVCEGALRILSGPERIETGWWDGKDVARDYYVAANPDGVHLWIYRRRRAPRDWYLHGTFA